MKISPQVARIIDFKTETIGSNSIPKATCPFCKSQMLISVGDSITCHRYGGCPYKFSAYAVRIPAKPEDHIVIDCIKFIIEMKTDLKMKPIMKVEEDGTSRPIIKGMGTKKAFRIENDYTTETSSILSYKGRPFEMKLDSLLNIDFSSVESIIKKIETYLTFS